MSLPPGAQLLLSSTCRVTGRRRVVYLLPLRELLLLSGDDMPFQADGRDFWAREAGRWLRAALKGAVEEIDVLEHPDFVDPRLAPLVAALRGGALEHHPYYCGCFGAALRELKAPEGEGEGDLRLARAYLARLDAALLLLPGSDPPAWDEGAAAARMFRAQADSLTPADSREALLRHAMARRRDLGLRSDTLRGLAPWVRESVDAWLREVRAPASVPRGPGDPAHAALRETLALLGDPVPPERVAFVVQSGSFMYNLHTERSDRDFFIAFVSPVSDFLGLSEPRHVLGDHAEDKGFGADKSEDVEFSAHELGFLLKSLVKGGTHPTEMLFATSAVFESPLWRAVRAERRRFLTQRTVGQYLGHISSRLAGFDRYLEAQDVHPAAKMLYAAFHKLFELRRIVAGEEPLVRVAGEEREFIMRIREGPLEVDLLALRAEAEQMFQEIKADGKRNAAGLPDEVDRQWVAEVVADMRLGAWP